MNKLLINRDEFLHALPSCEFLLKEGLKKKRLPKWISCYSMNIPWQMGKKPATPLRGNGFLYKLWCTTQLDLVGQWFYGAKPHFLLFSTNHIKSRDAHDLSLSCWWGQPDVLDKVVYLEALVVVQC